ncbi:flagellar basal body-associated FliL family protein [Thioclava sp.]|uniref:flagellar basal body-associated FliL family protein n=1 Tax=Thioclava sp. TaxID=1933450 RepID=UPI003AA84B4F
MFGKIFPILLAVIGLAAGGGAGYYLRPPPPDPEATADCAPISKDHGDTEVESTEEITATSEFVKLNNQFIVPVVEDGLVSSLVIMSLSLEVKTGSTEKVYRAEPKLRDAFLQVLFDHANTGGFAGAFTGSANMDRLRTSLTETARTVLGSDVIGVLVSDIVRQDT